MGIASCQFKQGAVSDCGSFQGSVSSPGFGATNGQGSEKIPQTQAFRFGPRISFWVLAQSLPRLAADLCRVRGRRFVPYVCSIFFPFDSRYR